MEHIYFNPLMYVHKIERKKIGNVLILLMNCKIESATVCEVTTVKKYSNSLLK